MEAPKPNDHPVAAAVSQEDTKKSRFFDDVIDPPGWLTQNYVEGALRTYENDPKLKVSFKFVSSEMIPSSIPWSLPYRSPATR